MLLTVCSPTPAPHDLGAAIQPPALPPAKTFGRATSQRDERIEEILETLTALGKARELDNDRYIAVG